MLRRALLVLLTPAIVGCTGADVGGPSTRSGPSASAAASSPASVPAAAGTPSATPSRTTPSAATSPPAGVPTGSPAPTGPEASDGTPRRALLTVPSLGIRDLVVVPYEGFTDDAPGTEIQDRGRAASPYGVLGGTGPGGIGNYQVTAHRLSSTRAFEFLPRLSRGARVHVDAGGMRYTYRVTATRETSFRSERSLREQRAAVPGRPGVVPTRAMLTLSTCATIEDHGEGNFWSDEFGNPEHRIDKIGVLESTRPVTPSGS